MLRDDQLDQLVDRARASYRVPPVPDVPALWDGISERRAAVRPATRPRFARWWTGIGMAAAVAGAFALGRMSTSAPEAPVVTVDRTEPAAAPVSEVATDLLGQTAVLLTALPREGDDGRAFARQAGDLLLTTRLLLDAPVTQRNPALSSLLQDLELILAQVARLQRNEGRAELELITDAMRQQDLVPRIRTVAARLQAGAD